MNKQINRPRGSSMFAFSIKVQFTKLFKLTHEEQNIDLFYFLLSLSGSKKSLLPNVALGPSSVATEWVEKPVECFLSSNQFKPHWDLVTDWYRWVIAISITSKKGSLVYWHYIVRIF